MSSVLEKLRILDEQRAKLIDGAKAEALEKAEKAVAELNELGFHYRLTEESGSSGAKTARREVGPKRERKDVPCPICGFKTTPLHDGRLHRRQEKKKPFTAAELSERGLIKA